MTGLLKLAQQKVFGLGKSKAAQNRRTLRERPKLFVADKTACTVEISGRIYRIASDGSFRLREATAPDAELLRKRALKEQLDEKSREGIVDSRDKTRFRTGKEKRAGYFATRPATETEFAAQERARLGHGIRLSDLLSA